MSERNNSSARYTHKRWRKINYSWEKPEEVSGLIAAVKKRPALWDAGCPDYKIAHFKAKYWQEVANELGIKEVGPTEAKFKWNRVRNLFKANLAKYRSRTNDQGAEDIQSVKWYYFSELLFIESAEVQQSAAPISLEGVSESVSEEPQANPVSCLPASTSSTLTPPPAGNVKELAVKVLTKINARPHERPRDRFSIVGEHIAEHLRRLDDGTALQLESLLIRTLYDYLDDYRGSSTVKKEINDDRPTTKAEQSIESE